MRVPRLKSYVSRRLLLTGGVAALVPWAPTANAQGAVKAASQATATSRPIDISARRLETFRKLTSEKKFGRLEFRGGLVLTSSDPDFGGLSGVAIEPDGKSILSITDAGSWLTADVTYAGTAPTGLTNARMGPIVASSGRELTRKRDQDAEAVCLIEGNLMRGIALIAFERNHRIGRFPVLNRVLQPPTSYLKLPADVRQMSSNKGFEAMTVLQGGPHKGAVVAFSERLLDAAGHHTGWIWLNGDVRRFQIKDFGEFDLTDCIGLPDGSLLLLERRFRWTEGVKMQLRLLKANEFGPGMVGEGALLLSADMTSDIDNMEGLGLHRDASGATVLTLVSDDNFNAFLQRTILLQFALA
jgi:hypothetical protein